MTSKVTLPWVEKIRDYKKSGLSPANIIDVMLAYGEKEEKRITKEFEEAIKRCGENVKDK